jgi:hypothetical protein
MPPSISIILRAELTADQIAAIEGLLQSFATNVRRENHFKAIAGWFVTEFFPQQLINPQPDELANLTNEIGIGVTVATYEAVFKQDAFQYREALGFTPPDQHIGCWAMLKGPIVHRVLGSVTLLIAELVDGYVQFEHHLYPPTHPQWFNRTQQKLVRKYGYIPYDLPAPFQYSGPGQVYEMYYDLNSLDPNWHTTVMDTVAFRAFMNKDSVYLGN